MGTPGNPDFFDLSTLPLAFCEAKYPHQHKGRERTREESANDALVLCEFKAEES